MSAFEGSWIASAVIRAATASEWSAATISGWIVVIRSVSISSNPWFAIVSASLNPARTLAALSRLSASETSCEGLTPGSLPCASAVSAVPTSVAIWGEVPPETVPTPWRVGSRLPFHASTAASFCACADAAFDALRCLSMPS